MEEGGQALEEKAALGFQRGFLAGKRLAEFPWEEMPSHFVKTWPLFHREPRVSSPGMLASTWPNGLWRIQRRILELGSGIGLTGIAICKACHPREYIFSDHHKGVLQQLSENLQLNGLTLEAESCSHRREERPNHQGHLDVDLEDDHVQISIKELDWNLVSKDELAKLQVDHLIGVLQKFPRDGGNRATPEVYIAFNIRNPDTYHDFQMQLDKVDIGRETVATSWKNLFPYDQHANIVILRLHV
ncbi:hypothetical protein E2320_011995 [Naja naja]|nr:hypothetical protein E2320_011995 [Naja naja]